LKPFVWQARVYYEDTDAGGVVYHANYLRFLERSRTEWLRARGISQLALARDPGVVFSVVAIEARFRLPARLDDLLSISCEPAEDGGASILFSQRIWREPLAAELLLTASVRVACLDAATLKPRRLPQVITRELPA
jgi:acyl-CoA thioester hydrolase